MLRRLLSQFAFAFVVLAAVLFWQGYNHRLSEGNSPRVVMQWLGGALLAAAGLAGLRERHRPPTSFDTQDGTTADRRDDTPGPRV